MASGNEKGKDGENPNSSGPCPGDPVVRLPITGTVDLHTFLPSELEPLLQDYLTECLKEGISEIRIIHGKGKGIQRRRVHAFLSRNPLVQSYHDADPWEGGWGVTVVFLRNDTTETPGG